MIEPVERRLWGVGAIQERCTGMNPHTGHCQHLTAIAPVLRVMYTYVFHWTCVTVRRTSQEESGIMLTPWCQTTRARRSSSSEAVSRTSSRCHRKANSWDSGFINKLNNSGVVLVKMGASPRFLGTHQFVVYPRRSRVGCKPFGPKVLKCTILQKWILRGLGA